MNTINAIVMTCFAISTCSCQSSTTLPLNMTNLNTDSVLENRIIDGIDISDPVFTKGDIELHKYKYKNDFLENLKTQDLLKKGYRDNIIEYIKYSENEDDKFKSTFISRILVLRIVQLKDRDAFYILSEISKDRIISYSGIEMFPDIFTCVFIENIQFFIQQSLAIGNTGLIDFALMQLDEILVKPAEIHWDLGATSYQPDCILLRPQYETFFSDSLQKKIAHFPTQKVFYDNSMNPELKGKDISYINIESVFRAQLFSALNDKEKAYFSKNILPVLNHFTVPALLHDQKWGIVIDPDGEANIRTNPSSSAEIAGTVAQDDIVVLVRKQGSWWQVQTQSLLKGYIHESRIGRF